MITALFLIYMLLCHKIGLGLVVWDWVILGFLTLVNYVSYALVRLESAKKYGKGEGTKTSYISKIT